MEKNGVIEGLRALPPPAHLTVAVAINGDRKSTKIVKWALENFIPEGKTFFKLLHARPKITAVPTPSKLFPFHVIFNDFIHDTNPKYKKQQVGLYIVVKSKIELKPMYCKSKLGAMFTFLELHNFLD